MDDSQNTQLVSTFPLTARYQSLYFPQGESRIGNPGIGVGLNSARRARQGSRSLACIGCRRKKVKVGRFDTTENFGNDFVLANASKCHIRDESGPPCDLCARIGAECEVPLVDERKLSNSRRLITELYGRIAALEAELQVHRTECSVFEVEKQQDMGTSPTTSMISEISSGSDNMIMRLCGGQRQLNSDRAGRLRFFGPTSSLHLTESVTSSVLLREPNSTREKYQWQDTIPLELQSHLFELYWKYQHQVIPIIHRECKLECSL